LRTVPFTLGRAWDLLDALVPVLVSCPGVDAVEPAGDVRRFESIVSGVVLVVRAADPERAIDALIRRPELNDVVERTPRRLVARFRTAEVDVRVAPPDEYGTVLFTTTGTAAHVSAIRQRSAPGFDAAEADVYQRAGLPFIAPELREGGEEIEAAHAGRLPALVTRTDIRGDLHMHTTFSDGRDSLREMVSACRALGYEYIAITDHSFTSAASRTVSADQLAIQRDEIEQLRGEFKDIAILHGAEVDILPNGRLDFSDDVLAGLDIVLASLHEQAGQSGARLTERCLAAIRHPLVAVVTHPSNRLVGHREGYDLDYPRLYEAAAETGTVLEIDGAPSHLDLDGAHAREAIAAGVTVSIDSDCHRALSLDRQMRMGVGTARRGWVEARHVLNARPLSDVQAFLAAKRERRART
jgi:DNA polymerase (family X)